jgi:hypothetical protein
MKISFDFDSTLSEQRTQNLAHKLMSYGVELWIISSRVNEDRWGWNKELYRIAEKLHIPKGRIVLTGGDDKWKFCKENNIDIHFDDDPIEIELIEENYLGCVGVIIFDPDISYRVEDIKRK